MKKHLLSTLIAAALACTATNAQANSDHSAPVELQIRLADDSIIDSINQLGELDFSVPKTQYFTTNDGVPVAFTPLHQLPMVDVSVSFAAGSAYDTQIRSDGAGIGNMVASMLTQGTKTLDEDAFIYEKEKLGVVLNSSIDKDFLNISLRSLSDDDTLNSSLKLLNEAISAPRFDADVLERNKDRLITALKQQAQNPAYVAALAFDKALYGTHPYAQPTTGDEMSIGSIHREDLLNYHQKFFNKQNAKITLTGDLDLAKAKQIANTISRAIASGGSHAAQIAAPKKSRATHIHIDHDSTQTQVIIGQQIAGERTDSQSRQAFSDFTLGNDALAGSDFTARLMKTIREEKGYTYGIYGNAQRLKSGGSYAIRFSVQQNADKAAIKDTIAVILDTLNNGIDNDELELVRLGSKNSFPELFASNASIHSTTHRLFTLGYPQDHIATRLERLDNATLNSVNAALKNTLQPREFIIITVGKHKPDLSEVIDNLSK